MRAIELCRTAELGGHMERCESCGFERPVYNSCRNRHCPKCRAFGKARWLEARSSELLPVGYFHVVFTVPHELNGLALCNKRTVYDILVRTASQTLHEFAAEPRHGLGGRIGFTAVLHTWDQQLRYHVHLHCLVAGGALSADGKRWTHARKGFLFPVRALSKVFRGKFIDLLTQGFARGELRMGGSLSSLARADRFAAFTSELRDKDWVVYCRRPLAAPQGLLNYLGRYTHRVAISNHRISEVSDGKVSFTYRDRAGGEKGKTLTLSAFEFIRRFLLHVLPEGYVRVRHFGLLSPRRKGQDLPRCRELLGRPPLAAPPEQQSTEELMLELTGCDLSRCPQCGEGTMRRVRQLSPLPRVSNAFPHPEPVDTS